MKPIYVILTVLFCLTFSQSCKKISPVKGEDTSNPIPNITGASVLLNDGGIIFLNETNGLTRVDMTGHTIWNSNSSTINIQTATVLVKYDNEDVLMAGTQVFRDPNFTELFYHTTLARVGSNGSLKWVISYVHPNLYMYTTIEDGIALPNDEVCISTNQKPVFLSGNKMTTRLLKIDGNGNLLKQRYMDTEYLHFGVVKDNKILVTYEPQYADAILADLDFDLNTLWELPVSQTKSFEGFHDELGLIYSKNVNALSFPELTSFDYSGNIRWQKSYPDLIGYCISSVDNYSGGGYVLTGQKPTTQSDQSDMFFIHLDANGDILYNSQFDFDNNDRPRCIFSRGNDILIAGAQSHTEGDAFFGTHYEVISPIWLSLNEKGELK